MVKSLKIIGFGMAVWAFCAALWSGLAHAESGNEVDVNLSVNAAIAISAPSNLAFEIDASPFGTFSEQEIDVHVSTNNTSGYTLTMSSTTEQVNLVNQADGAQVISSLSADPAGGVLARPIFL